MPACPHSCRVHPRRRQAGALGIFQLLGLGLLLLLVLFVLIVAIRGLFT